MAGTTSHKKRKPSRLEIFKGKSGGFYWRLKAANNKIVATGGESFDSKSNAKNSALNVVYQIVNNNYNIFFENESYAKIAYRIVIYKGKDNWRWRMKAGNHKIIAHSGESFYSKENVEKAVDTFIEVSFDPNLIINEKI